MRKGFIYLFVFFVFIGCSLLNAKVLEVKLNRQNVTLGDVYGYDFVIKPQVVSSKNTVINVNIATSDKTELLTCNFKAKEKGINAVIEFASYQLGENTVPTVEISFADNSYTLKATTINVISSFEKGVTRNLILKLKPQMKITLKWWNYLALGLLFFVIGYIIFKIIKKYTTGEPIISLPVKIIDPYKRACEKLKDIESRGMWEKDYHEYYFELSYVFKEYLDSRLSFGKSIMDLTTSEIRKVLSDKISKEIKDSVYSYLVGLDPVKYAAYQPSVNESRGKIVQTLDLLAKIESGLNTEKKDEL